MRILIASGGSTHSELALQLGAQLLSQLHSDEVPTVITVIKDKTSCPKASRVLTRACEILLGGEVPAVRTKTRIGQPTEEIIREAEAGDYDLIIVGERASHRLITRFLGSTARGVIEKAPCPVLIAKGEIRPIRHILFCDSGAYPSVMSRLPTQVIRLLEAGVEATILHVMSQISAGPSVPGKQLRANATELIQTQTPEGELLLRDIQTLTTLNIEPNFKVRHGLVVDEILKETHSGDHDLVVIGDYQGQGWGRLLLENLARQIVIKIDRPVLIVR